jgi:hypothetical protein
MKTRYFAMSALVVLAVALLAGRLPEARAVGDNVFGFGTLRTDFTPAAVANKGGWRIVGQTGFQRSGAAVMLPAFSYQVEFRGVPGFDSPPRQTVVVEKDKTTVINAAYTISAGRLTVTLDPGDARAAGAGWRVVGETGFHFSEATVTLPPGSYVVEFQSAAGFGLPQRKTVAVASRRTTELFVDYPPPPGNPLASLPNLQLSRAGTVSAMVVQPDGDVIVGGQFTAVNDVARNNLARLHADGTLDETWNPSADDAVYALHLEGPNLFVGGAFTLIAGQRRPALALLDAATGALLPTFDAGLAGATEPRPPPIENLGSDDRDDPTLRTYVKTFVRHGDHLFIGGSFTSAQGELHSRLAKLSATDGNPDPAWVPPTPNSFVLKLLPLGDQLYVAGRFGRLGSVALRGLARVTLDGKGALDSRWRPLKLAGQQYIAALATDGTDLFAGGGDAATEFSDNILAKLSTAGEGSIVKRWETLSPVELLEVRDGKFYYNELSRVARADAGGSGAIDTAWNAGSSKIGNNFYRALAFPDGAILLAGTTTETTAFFPTGRSLTAVAQSLSKVDPVTGDRDPAHRVRIEVRGKINAVVRQPDGQIVVGGDFQFANGVSRLNVLRLSADGHLDAT